MKLMTPELEKRFAEVGSQRNVKDPVIIVRFFDPLLDARWYATEYDPETQTFFGYGLIFGVGKMSWGYFSLAQLEAYNGPKRIGLKRDLYFEERKISSVIR